MAAPAFIAWQADTSALTGPPAAVATAATAGTVKTILQVKTGAGKIRVVEWGYGFDSTPPAPCRVELVETGTIFATVTTLGSGVRAYNDASGAVSQTAAAGAASTGFNATVEGSVVATRLLGFNYENGIYFKQQFPLGREPEVNAASSLRVRATPGSNVALNIWCYIVWEE
jgi:hypothetical protein